MKTPLSQQAQDIYSLLLAKGPMNATQIAAELNIFPHAVYRSTKQLQALGSVNIMGKHPALFEAKPVIESVEMFALLQRDWFLSTFLTDSAQNPLLQKDLNISFIDSREMLFEKALLDIQHAREEMDNLASGDELPAEIMLAQKQALDRGVTIRTLFQKRNEYNESFIQARTKMGEQMRITEALNTRIVIFDRRIVYIMSYDPTNYIKSNGIRFEYAPVGQLMYQVFMKHWAKGIEV
jgi:sugar-specific transcriptional regulator TrmB